MPWARQRFVADRDRHTDRLNGLRRIGIDEISHRKGQKYMTVVVCHDSGKVVWMADGHGKRVLHAFFDVLGAERAGRLTHVSADGALWIAEVLAERAPAALRVMDPFHVVAWATEALDTERRASWNRARRGLGEAERARALKDSRLALWKNEADLTDRQANPFTTQGFTGPPERETLADHGTPVAFTTSRTTSNTRFDRLDRERRRRK